MNPDAAAELIALLAAEDGLSLPRVAKRLGLSMSELMRLLAVLGPDEGMGGLALVERRASDGRECLFITAKGRALCQ